MSCAHAHARDKGGAPRTGLPIGSRLGLVGTQGHVGQQVLRPPQLARHTSLVSQDSAAEGITRGANPTPWCAALEPGRDCAWGRGGLAEVNHRQVNREERYPPGYVVGRVWTGARPGEGLTGQLGQGPREGAVPCGRG